MGERKQERAVVVSNRELVPDIYDMWIEAELAREARPGQFIAVYPKGESTLLPRPISICETDRDRGRARIVYRVAGKGTREFSGYRADDEILVMGALGNGFPLAEAAGKRALLLGGGIGLPPLVQLAKELEGRAQIAAGYRDGRLFLREDLERYGTLYVATQDGSAGTKGTVLDAIRANALSADVVFACGPMPMLRAVKRYAREAGVRAYLSLEERMACGVGACLGCVCRTTARNGHSHVNNARICTDGPVFEASEVELE